MTRARPGLGGLTALACAVLAACGSGGGDAGGSASTATRARQASRLAEPPATFIPGEIDPNPQGFFPRVVLNPIVNAWRTSSPRRFTEVDAGASQDDHSVGVLGIFRGRTAGGAQRGNLVKVIGSGPLRIVGAPLGRSATRAQGRGEIRFVGASGIRGALRLRDEVIVLEPPTRGAG